MVCSWKFKLIFGLTDLTLQPRDGEFTTHFDDNANIEQVILDKKFWNKIGTIMEEFHRDYAFLIDIRPY